MSARIQQLAMRRRALVLRSARLRGELAQDLDAAAASVRGIDRAVAIGRRLTKQPALLAGAAALVLMLRPIRPIRAITWAGKALMFVSVARRMLGVVTALRARAAATTQ